MALGGNYLHFKGDAAATEDLLDALAQATGISLPSIERRDPTYSRRRPRKPIQGQMTVDDFIEENECPPAQPVA